MKIKELGHPSLYDDAYYDREGANLDKIEITKIGNLFKKFSN